MLNIFKQERRYTVFDEKTFSRLLKTIKTMTTYTLDTPVKRKLTDYYYDNANNLLEENELEFMEQELWISKKLKSIK